MELELSLGDSPAPVKATVAPTPVLTPTCMGDGEDLELVLGVRAASRDEQDNQTTCTQSSEEATQGEEYETRPRGEAPVESLSFPLFVPSAETGSANSEVCTRGFDVNTRLADGGAAAGRPSSPSSMQEVSTRQQVADQEAADDEDNGGGGARKKLRLSKEQSSFLEDSFKEHSTLTPKQKSDLANRLNLRPRQVEVWFQNRRARTKLKQTEVDCEHLKRCCERLTRENRRLQREVAELRGSLRTTSYPPLYGLHHLPAASTVFRVCPSCEHSKVVAAASESFSSRVFAGGTADAAMSSPAAGSPPSSAANLFGARRPHFGPFAAVIPPVLRRQPSATSLGDSPAPVKATVAPTPVLTPTCMGDGEDLELVLGVRAASRDEQDNQTTCTQSSEEATQGEEYETRPRGEAPVESLSFPLFVPSAETGSANSEVCTRGFDVNTRLADGGAAAGRPSSPSSMQEVSTRQQVADQEAADDEDNGGGGARKKLRLSKEQSSFLEDSFKEHSTLTPKQKSDLANRLNLRPRQVEVWFQNRRARTKLKQTEVDCEHLKRCCERLTRENRRLQREVAELRGSLRTTSYPPLYGLHHLPAASTVFRVCPSCEHSKVVAAASESFSSRVFAGGTADAAMSSPAAGSPPSSAANLFGARRPHFGPFAAVIPPVLRRQPSATS
uniref:Homeobox domain-containing protein n=2 Tax=Oryza punctata TaxID=4537 RepID=A0A0E0K1C4_ORYPU